MDRYSQRITSIEILKEILELLKITEKYASDRNRTTKSEKMLIVLTLVIHNETA